MPTGEKTERATPKKRRDERKKGNVFLSNDAVSVAVMLGTFSLLWLYSGTIISQIDGYFKYCYSLIENGFNFEQDMTSLVTHSVLTLVLAAGPVMLSASVIAIVVTFFQTKMLFAPESIKPKFSKINPLEGFKRLFSLKSVVDALKGILKISILLFIMGNFIYNAVNIFTKYYYTDLAIAGSHFANQVFIMIFQIGIAYIVLAAFDFGFQWWDYERKLKMTKQEVKEEYKQIEGDPKVKAKMKEIQRRRATSRMMQQVPEADVIIRNPTHFAVALRYKQDVDKAPLVLAKGQDSLALKIIEVGEQNKVKIIENIPLARALYAGTEINRPIPEEFYGAVAEVLVYLYRLDGKLKKGRN